MISPIVAVIIVILMIPVLRASLSLAPYVPVRKKDVSRIVKLAKLKPGMQWFELGSGDGRVTIEAAKSGATAIGIEIIPELVWFARHYAKKAGVAAKFVNRDVFTVGLGSADVVYTFSMPDKINGKFKEKLERELKDGAVVISSAFTINGWTPEEVDKPTPQDLAVYRYVWRKPAKQAA